MARTPFKKSYPLVEVLLDPKAPAPNNYYALVTVRKDGITIQMPHMSRGKCEVFAAGLQKAIREDHHGQEGAKQLRGRRDAAASEDP